MRYQNQTYAAVETVGRDDVSKRFWLEAVFLVKASRPGFWLTALWFYLLPFGGKWPLDSFGFWLGVVYVGLPLGMLIYASNDVTDERTDRLNPRKDSFLFGARPNVVQIAMLPARIVGVQIPFVILGCWVLGPRALVWFAAVVGVTTFYNRFAKDRVGFDVLAQAGYLMVFVLANWLNGLDGQGWAFWVFGALFAMHSHVFGEIMDIEPDRLAERRTTAVVIGARASKVLISGLLILETLLATTIVDKPWLSPMLAAGAIGFALDAVLWRERAYPMWAVRVFFLGWNAFLAAEIALSFALA